jgi:hypothetical protein
MNRRIMTACFSMAIAFGIGTAGAQERTRTQAAPKAVKVAPEKALEHVGETVIVEMVVRSGKKADTSERYFLDSDADYKSPTNLAVVIPFETAKAIEKGGVKDILAHYSDKTIRVTGKVVRSADQTRIFVTNAKQIELVEKKPE